MTENVIIWLVLLIVFIIGEILSLGLTSVWFAGGALVSLIAAYLGVPVLWQIIIFIVVSTVLLVFTRPVAMKHFNTDRVKTNVEEIVGKKAIVIEPVDNLNATGQVRVDLAEWSARSTDENIKFRAGDTVIVDRVEGVKLIVKADDGK
ncbi:MAG: NfeD family protein [Lachnospiraceae bacterium]|nr:NfeD family protein [Lachnospiraceae bacterium]